LNYKKSILTLSTILLFISPFCITIYFIIKKETLKYTYEERFENKEKETFTLIKDEIVWIKKGKEVLINHHIFDIKEISYQENKIIVTGWFDDEEQKLDNHFAKTNNQSNKKSSFPFFTYFYWQENIQYDFTFNVFNTTKEYINFSRNIVQHFYDCNIPPPKTLI
jgi:hypothetical protein